MCLPLLFTVAVDKRRIGGATIAAVLAPVVWMLGTPLAALFAHVGATLFDSCWRCCCHAFTVASFLIPT